MSAAGKVTHEIKAILLAALFFGAWIGALVGIKSLLLAEYQISFHGFSKVLIGTLILSKVVLIMDHVPLGSWVREQPAWVDVVLRTFLCSLGVLVVLILEKGIEGRHDHGGFDGAVAAAFRGTDAPHIWANSICVTGALLVWNAAGVIERHLGKRGLLRLFLVPKPQSASVGPPVQPDPTSK